MNTKRKTLFPLIKQDIEQKTEINTDGAAVYGALPELGYTHNVVIHNREFVAEDGTHTNSIENVWSHFKVENRSRRGVKAKMREQYLQEFQWRWNTRKQGLTDYDALISEIAIHYPL